MCRMKLEIFICIVTVLWCEIYADRTCQQFVGFSSVGAHNIHVTGLIQFRKDLFDSGHGWVRDIGTYTIMCAGVYHVSFTGYGDSNTRLILKKRLISAKNAWEPIISTPPAGGSTSIITRLNKGEQIAVYVSGTLRTDIEQPVSVTSFNAYRITN